MKKTLVISIFILFVLATPAYADTVIIGPGVVADVSTDLITPATIVENIRNTTGVTAEDFHIRFTETNTVISFTYSVNNPDAAFRMDGPVPNNGFLMVDQMRKVIIVKGNIVSIDAFWTDANGKEIPTPEPATVVLLSTGLAGAASVVRKRRKPETKRKV